ncbi:UNVERIFIED_CONTAM: putative mitochondrial protein [Sesamum indicum]
MKLGFINAEGNKPAEGSKEIDQKTEIEVLEKNHTWDITKLCPHKKAIGCKWIFKLKLKPDGSIDRYKARLVAKDDVSIAGPSKQTILEIKDYLHDTFTIKDLGPARFFLRLEIARSNVGFTVTQTKYTRDIITDVKLMEAKAKTIPLPTATKLTTYAKEYLPSPEPYRRLLRRLLYLGITRPDICC